MRWTLVVIVALGGCNPLLGLDDVIHRDAGGDTIPCTPLKFDPARYRAVGTGSQGLSWAQARMQCVFMGYDLAVIDEGDTDELTNELGGAPLPFWVGINYGTDWSAVDGCTPVLDWGTSEPSESKLGDCAARTSQGGLHSDQCTHTTSNSDGYNVLCETPRPSVRCLQLQAERTYAPVSGTMNHTDAEAACSALGMHIVEINSTDELNYVLGHFGSTPEFWIGARRSGSTITSVTGCPQAFTWGPMDPDMTSDCTIYAAGPMQSTACDATFPGVICEKNSPL